MGCCGSDEDEYSASSKPLLQNSSINGTNPLSPQSDEPQNPKQRRKFSHEKNQPMTTPVKNMNSLGSLLSPQLGGNRHSFRHNSEQNSMINFSVSSTQLYNHNNQLQDQLDNIIKKAQQEFIQFEANENILSIDVIHDRLSYYKNYRVTHWVDSELARTDVINSVLKKSKISTIENPSGVDINNDKLMFELEEITKFVVTSFELIIVDDQKESIFVEL